MIRLIRLIAAIGFVGALGWTSAGAQVGAPAAFGKIAPADGATSMSVAPTLSWTASSVDAAYWYCLDTTNDNACAQWNSTGGATSATPSGLSAGTTYYWQVRAGNTSSTMTYADGGATDFWSFTTPASPPGGFSKTTPVNGATGLNVTPVLEWERSLGATSYEYCYDATNDNACATWTSTGTNPLVALSGLSPSTTYYWYVRANNAFGTSYANGGAAWTFATQAAPGGFTKAGPANASTGLPISSFTLSWNAAPGVTNYELCYGLIGGSSCSLWRFVGPGTSYTISDLEAGTTYYWQVRANSPGGPTYADGGTFWAFTTQVSSGPFGKLAPSDGEAGLPLSFGVAWGSSAGASRYEYCYDTTNDGSCANWFPTSNTYGALNDLAPDTVYYWQVRAVNPLGATYADGDPAAFRSFRTAPVKPPPNLPCNVLSLNGTTAYAASADTVLPIAGSLASFTAEAWVRPGAILPTSGYQSIVADDGYSLFLGQFVSGALQVAFSPHPRGVNDLFWRVGDSRVLTLNEWHHVAFIYDDAAKQARFGIDGVLGPALTGLNMDFTPSGRTLMVGGFDGADNLNGFVDNVRISSVARYTSDTYTPPENMVSDADTRALYQFGQASGSTTITDESGNGHTLTGTGGAQTTSGGGCFDPTAPTVTAIVPNSGPTTGGTLVAITGTNFQPDATVNIGGAMATGVTVNSATSITATTAASGSAGAMTVEVMNPDAKLGTLVNSFTYFTALPAAFSKASPSSGATGSTATTLRWFASSRATSYEYCIDSTNDDACLAWTNSGPNTSAVVTGLAASTTYYWHVRAINATGVTYANGGGAAFWSFTTGTMPPLPDFRDFNGDGKPDLVWQHPSGARYVWFMNGTTLSSGAFLSPNPMDPALDIVGVNDFTGDGKPDLLMWNTIDRTVTLYYMDGVNHVASQPIQPAQYSLWRVVATGDFNGDGKPDIVWQNFTNGQIYIWYMSSSGGAATYGGAGGAFAGDFVRDAAFNIVSMGGTSVVGAGDIDLDGDEDLVLQNWNTGALSVWYLNGTLRTSTGSISPGAVDPNWRIKNVGDYNGDGKADFIFEHTNGSLYIWFMNGGTFSSGTYLTPAAVNPAWQIFGLR